jgi:hypothetical protein
MKLPPQVPAVIRKTLAAQPRPATDAAEGVLPAGLCQVGYHYCGDDVEHWCCLDGIPCGTGDNRCPT